MDKITSIKTSKVNHLMVLLIIVTFLLNPISIDASSNHEDFIEQANTLKALGLFKGSDVGFELDRYGTRVEAAVIIVRLLGVETFATNINYQHPFSDVPPWADDYIGYLYHEGLTNGISDSEYGSNLDLSPSQFMTFCLRSLAYDDSLGDFTWTEALNKAVELGIIDVNYSHYLSRDEEIYRDDMVAVLYNMLNHEMYNKNTSLIDFLIEKNIFTIEKAKELDIYKQVEKVSITGSVTFIDEVNKAVITDTINNYNYYILLPFASDEESYVSVINIQNDNMTYECIITKEAYYTSDIFLELNLGQTLTISGEIATNVLENNNNKGYIIIK